MQITKILVAIDFSESSLFALAEARLLADAYGATLHLLHVVSEPLEEPWSGFVPADSLMATVERLQKEASNRLAALVPPADVARGRVVVSTGWGDPADEILKYAATHDVNLVVCGTHGRRGFNRFVTGSVAERVVRFAPCPVLTVHSAIPAVA